MSLYITDENGKLHKLAGAGGGAGSTINVDSELNAESTNPVQNKVLYNPVTFAESERQKSKNLLKFPYGTSYKSTYGITFTNNGDGSFTLNGQQSSTSYNSVQYLYLRSNGGFKLSAGTYTVSLSGNIPSSSVSLVVYDGTYYRNANITTPQTFTISEEKTLEIYLQVGKTSTETFNNVIVKPMIVKGTEAGDWHEWNGAIVHEKDIQPNIITGRLLASYIPPTDNTYYDLPLVVYNKVGTKLSINSDGRVVVGSGVKYVKACTSSVIGWYSRLGGVIVCIRKNGTIIQFAYVDIKQANTINNDSCPLSPVVFPVVEGDVISMTVWQSSGVQAEFEGHDTACRNSLTVEVVE